MIRVHVTIDEQSELGIQFPDDASDDAIRSAIANLARITADTVIARRNGAFRPPKDSP